MTSYEKTGDKRERAFQIGSSVTTAFPLQNSFDRPVSQVFAFSYSLVLLCVELLNEKSVLEVTYYNEIEHYPNHKR